MKKLYSFFVIFSVISALAVGAAGYFLLRFSWILSLVILILGAGFWTAAFFRFRSIDYLDDGEVLTIRRGIFFRAETSVGKSGILYVTTVKFGSVTLFSVLHTASGRVVIFAEFVQKPRSNAEF
ncbi:MAG: hypothetical protein K2J77_00860 [Oscillospiraceae bacterium]|nr:hypothetical protein [Oscillospiraceae bacterium]